MKREELFASVNWHCQQLMHELRGIIQNPVEISPEDFLKWRMQTQDRLRHLIAIRESIIIHVESGSKE